MFDFSEIVKVDTKKQETPGKNPLRSLFLYPALLSVITHKLKSILKIVQKKTGCPLTIGLKYSTFIFLVDQFLQLVHKGTDIFKFPVYRRKTYICHSIQILQMLHDDLSDLGAADLTIF